MSTQKDPFAILASEEKKIKVEALGGAEVTIKTSLTVAEQLIIDEIYYGKAIPNQDGKFSLNPSDYGRGVTQTVAFVLVEPKKTLEELEALPGGDKAVREINDAFLELKSKS